MPPPDKEISTTAEISDNLLLVVKRKILLLLIH